MKFVVATIAVFAGAAVAQLNLPPCAKTCAAGFVSGQNFGGCSSVDIGCICKNGNFLDQIACCLAASCSIDDQQQATSEAINFCSIAGGVTGLPTAVTCRTAATATPTASGSGTTSTGTSSAATTTSSSSSTASAAGQAIPTSSRISSSVSAAASPSTTRNAGVKNVAGAGAGVLGAVVAALL